MKMGFSLVLATLLCFTTWMTSVDTTHGPAVNCCVERSKTRVPVERIMNYTIQPETICPIKAIVFLTSHGKSICSDPESKWAVKAKNKVDEERKKALQVNGQTEEGSASDIMTPACATASTKAPQKKHTNKQNGNGKWRRQRKRGRKARRELRRRV